MARIVSIDYGKKRTGLAVTDPLQIIPGGLATVSTSTLFEFLSDYVQKEQVERIVIGEPRQPNGQPSENLARVQQFLKKKARQDKALVDEISATIILEDYMRSRKL